jgi:hypothetical protein
MFEIRDIGTANLPDAARLCLAGKSPGDRPRAFTKDVELDATRCKLSLLHERMARGARAFAAFREGLLAGYLEVHPVAAAPVPVAGENCHVLQCVRVPQTAERGETERALIDHAAGELAASGGLAVIAREKDWSACGFAVAARDGAEVPGHERVLWWRGLAGGKPPRLVPIDRHLAKIPGKVRVDLFVAERCPWDRYVFDLVRGVCGRMKNAVVVYETDCNDRRNVLRSGIACGIAVDGVFQPWVRPYRLPDEPGIRRTLEDAM